MEDKKIEELKELVASCMDLAPRRYPKGSAAVLIPLVLEKDGLKILYELRSSKLTVQPAEVCFPGGGIEKDETPEQAAIRETCEELLIGEDQIEIVAPMEVTIGPSGAPLWPFVGILHDYQGTYSTDEVEKTFTLSYDWLLHHRPERHMTNLVTEPGADFPYDLIPGGESYHWRKKRYDILFYRETNPQLWGVTARLTDRFMHKMAPKANQVLELFKNE